MPHESYAQSLRVIGQALEALRISAFTLKKEGDKYIVRDWEPSYLRNIAGEVWGLGYSGHAPYGDKRSSDFLVYDICDTERLEASGRAKRGSKDPQNVYKISSGLRVVGDYLDKKRAVTFEIWWSFESVRIRYQTPARVLKEANFTVQNVHDFIVGMYLRRSSRKRVK